MEAEKDMILVGVREEGAENRVRGRHLLPGNLHWGGLDQVHEQLWAAGKGPAETALSEGAEEKHHKPEIARVFQREHTDLLYMCVVHQRHSGSEEGAPEGH